MKATHYLSILLFAAMLNACGNSKISSASTDTSAVASTPSTMATTSAGSAFSGKKWKLIELAGKPVADSINGKMPFISFNMADSSYTASGGCNGLGGKFTADTATMRIKFEQGMSTMMACPDMTVENSFRQIFDNTDNYSLNDSILSLNKARMAPLARFRAVE